MGFDCLYIRGLLLAERLSLISQLHHIPRYIAIHNLQFGNSHPKMCMQ